MAEHGDARRGKAFLYCDVSTLYHIGRWRLPASALALVRDALMRPSVEATGRASRAIFFTKKSGILPAFLRALGSSARKYFNVVFVFEQGATRYVSGRAVAR